MGNYRLLVPLLPSIFSLFLCVAISSPIAVQLDECAQAESLHVVVVDDAYAEVEQIFAVAL